MYNCLQGTMRMANGVAGAEQGLAVLPMVALQAEVVSLGEQVRGITGLGFNTSNASPRTEARWTRSSEAARGVLSRIIKKEIAYCSYCFWKDCMSKLKSKVHLTAYTHAHTQVPKSTWCVHPPLPIPKRQRFITENPRSVGAFSSTGMSPHTQGGVKILSMRSTLDLDVWTILRKKVKKKIRTKSLTIKFY